MNVSLLILLFPKQMIVKSEKLQQKLSEDFDLRNSVVNKGNIVKESALKVFYLYYFSLHQECGLSCL